MRLLYKILFGYFLIVIIIGLFSSYILIQNIENNANNYDNYRERELASLAKVLDAFIPNKETLKKRDELQYLFISVTLKLPHVKRITLHAQDERTLKYTHIVSSIPEITGKPSHQEDINAILNNKETLLYEDSEDGDRYLDITYPILNTNLKPIAALGIAVSLKESDEILESSKQVMKQDAIYSVLFAIAVSAIIALIVALIISKKIITPLEKLKKIAASTSANNLGEQVEITSNDEIGELALAFNDMTMQLDTLHSSLEHKVSAKTKELEIQFLIDSLTGLENRYAFFKYIKNLKEYNVAILDISSFKDINDAYGIDIGNRVLMELSKKYISYLVGLDLKLYRLSGDEMAILNTNNLSQNDFLNIIQEIIKKVEHETFYFDNDEIEINISIHAGISFEIEHAIEKANIALIEAKKIQSDYAVFNHEKYEHNEQRVNIKTISKIKHALDNFGIIPHYQGIVDREHKIIKYEALVRMNDNNKILSPYLFLDISKKTKYYQEITKNVIFIALEEFKNREESISLNLCTEDIINANTRNFIKEQLSNFNDPNRIVFELVESEDMHGIPDLGEFISYIKSTGAKIAIDDFGTGYSNFAYLMDMEPDYLKIDGSLIKNIDNDKRSYDIVKTIVTFAHGLDIKVIAEFIHSKEVLQICEELGVDEFQGYYFSEPAKMS